MRTMNIVILCKLVVIIGASLSEPHIDGDVRPTSRGMFVCMYLAAWCVCPPYVPEKSRAIVHIDRAP